MLTSSTAILAQTSNSSAWFTSTAPSTWVIGSGTSDYITESKDILSTSYSVFSLLPVILQMVLHLKLKVWALLMLYHLFHCSYILYIYLNFRLICCLLADSLNV